MLSPDPSPLSRIDPGSCRLLILDFDGVITHLPVDWDALRLELEELCRERFALEVSFRRFFDGREQVREERGPAALSEVDAMISRREMESLEDAVPCPGLRELLSGRQGLPAAICSSNSRVVLLEAVRRFGLSGLIGIVVGREDVRRLKPAPEGLLRILEEAGCRPEEALFIGDRDVDMLAGEAAGIPTRIVALALPPPPRAAGR